MALETQPGRLESCRLLLLQLVVSDLPTIEHRETGDLTGWAVAHASPTSQCNAGTALADAHNSSIAFAWMSAATFVACDILCLCSFNFTFRLLGRFVTLGAFLVSHSRPLVNKVGRWEEYTLVVVASFLFFNFFFNQQSLLRSKQSRLLRIPREITQDDIDAFYRGRGDRSSATLHRSTLHQHQLHRCVSSSSTEWRSLLMRNRLAPGCIITTRIWSHVIL